MNRRKLTYLTSNDLIKSIYTDEIKGKIEVMYGKLTTNTTSLDIKKVISVK